jgi:hypothetical protein
MNLPNHDDGPSELERRLMQIKTSNRQMNNKLKVADIIRILFDDPTAITLDNIESQVVVRLSQAQYSLICKLVDLPTDSTPQGHVDRESDEKLNTKEI